MAGDPGAVEATLNSRIGAILRATSGNFLEMFDFFAFGFYAAYIARDDLTRERLLREFDENHPEVIFLSEAFTRPKVMYRLAKLGFSQSYTYFAWRNTVAELVEYGTEVSGEAAAYMRPSFWPTTHDILTPYLQFGGRAAWQVRAALAATMVPTWGVYAGYELMEHVARPGAEEQIDNEKYELKDRRWDLVAEAGDSLAGWLTMLNRARREHPSLQLLRNLTFHHVDDENLIAYSKSRTLPDGTVEAEGRVLSPRDWTLEGERTVHDEASPDDQRGPADEIRVRTTRTGRN